MTKIEQMLAAGIPVIENQSDETQGSYAFSSMTREQEEKLNIILGGWDLIRGKRNQLLSACDWTQLPDTVMSFTQTQAWSEYRQALRDLPQTYANPLDTIWPQEPSYA